MEKCRNASEAFRSDFKYIAVKELQERRAIHYHVLCVYSKPRIFPKSEDIASSWKLGFVKISAPKLRLKIGKIVGYIGTYIGKGCEYGALDAKKSCTASQIRQIYKLSADRLSEVINKFGKEVAESYKCTYRKVYEILEIAPLRGKFLVMEFPSEWQYMSGSIRILFNFYSKT